MGFNSVEEILDYAIAGEEDAARFYTDLAAKVTTPGMSAVFREFALEEKGHKQKLLSIKSGGTLKSTVTPVPDLKIADYAAKVEPTPNMDYQHALLLAMDREKAAFRMYSDLAARAGDENARATFLALAQEEAKHKLRFEIEYDENILTEN